MDAVIDAVHGAADLVQAGACIVTDLFFGNDAALDVYKRQDWGWPL